MSKEEYSSPTPDFHVLKFSCAIIAREGRDVGSVDLLEIFLQTDINEDDKLMLLKLTGVVALLLVESEKKR